MSALADPVGGMRRQRVRAVLLGGLAAIAGLALLAASGWLVTRAAERPPVLALLAAIVVVRTLGLVRAFGRYGERLAAHDVAFRQLAALRVRWYRRLIGSVEGSELDSARGWGGSVEGSGVAGARGWGGSAEGSGVAGVRRGDGSVEGVGASGAPGRAATAIGQPSSADLLSRFVVDVDELQHRDLRVRWPAVTAAVASSAATAIAVVILPAAGLVVGIGLLIAGTLVPAVAYLAARGALRRQGAARSALADGLVEAMDAAPQLAVAGRAPQRLAALDASSAALAAIGRRDAAAAALAQALGALVAGATLIGVLLVAVGPAAGGELAPVWLGALALLTLGAFEAVGALPEAAARAVSVRAAERRLQAAVAVAPAPPPVAPAGPAALVPPVAPAGPAALVPPVAPAGPAALVPSVAPARAVALASPVAPAAPAAAAPPPASAHRPALTPASTPPAAAVLTAHGLRHRPGGDGGPAVLDGVELTLAPGERVAVIGASGAGKTVLVELLAGLVAPDEGTVALDGIALAQLDPAAVRERVRLAGQDAHLFATSIANNVRIGAPAASDEAVDTALRATGLGDWLDVLPDGARTLVGEDGAAVSGGQRQRIALARCLVSPARLLLLDEPTAMLDPPAAHAFLRDLDAAAGDRGVLAITHERIDLHRFDAVYELRAGRLRQVRR